LAFAWNAYVTYEEFLKAAASQQTNPISTGQSIQLSIAKLLFFSLLVGAVVWIGRIYRAHRHNYVLNRHRQNALGTFNTFVDSAHDAQTKSAVLLQATQAIFVIQPTGYISQEMDSGGLPQILEVVKTVIQGSSAKS
jgi:hypothetical protein